MNFFDSPSPNSTTTITIGFSTSPSSIGSSSSSSSTSSTSSSSSLSSRTFTCAYPSWPMSNTLSSPAYSKAAPTPSYLDSPPSSFISDEDLFGDLEPVLLTEAPEPPRQYHAPAAQPLPPLYPTTRPYAERKKPSPRRRSSGKKGPKSKVNMETIVEGRESG